MSATVYTKVFAWGSNKNGALGLGHEKKQNVPQLSPYLNDVVAIAGGSAHTLALTSKGDVYTFGSNEYGECGLGHNQESITTAQKINATKIVKIASSNNCSHSLLLDDQGRVFSFGTGNYGVF